MALVVVLMLLLVVTVLGVAGIRGALLQERMAANARARSIAFQYAESALREAEGFAATKPAAPTSGCSNGVCAMPAGVAPAWQGAGFWTGGTGWRPAATVADSNIANANVRYIVERYGESVSLDSTSGLDMRSGTTVIQEDIYRVVVWSRLDEGAEVMLQSYVRVQ